MRNTILKMTLAVLVLSTLAACGPSEQEKAEAKAIAINNEYAKRMRDNNIRIFGREAIEKSDRDEAARAAAK